MENTFENSYFDSLFDCLEDGSLSPLLSSQAHIYPTLAHESLLCNHTASQEYYPHISGSSLNVDIAQTSIATGPVMAMQIAWSSPIGQGNTDLGVGIGQSTLIAKE